MIKKIYYCDRCKKRVYVVHTMDIGGIYRKHLCGKCFKELKKWMK